ncbi:MAG TPA: class I SAM-dependent methyltransferase [Pyrinomonadaceae bacterium]
MKFQGVANVLRFNWHYYLYALVFALAFFIAARLFYQPILNVLALVAIGQALISVVISYFVYDHSKFYDFKWVDTLDPEGGSTILNIHSGFDESSEALRRRCPKSRLCVFDFYEAKRHTEVSIKRAQNIRAGNNGDVKISTTAFPVSDDYFDASFVVFSAHEIRDDPERIVFLRELRRTLKDSGRIIVTEHVRDVWNLLAYNLGAFHFLPVNTWLVTFKKANLHVSKTVKITPFVTAFVLEKDGTAS